MIKLKDAAKQLGVHKNTILRWEKEGKLVLIRTASNRLYVDPVDLNRIMNFNIINVN